MLDGHLAQAVRGDGALTHKALARGGVLLVGHGGGVELQRTARVGRKGLGAKEVALKCDGLGHGIGGEGDHLTAHLADGLLLLKGVAVDDDLTLALGTQRKLRHAAVAEFGESGEVEVVSVRLMILRQLYPDRAVCAPGVGGGRPGQNGLLGGGAVLDDHEHGIAEGHDHVVNGIRVVGEDGRGQTGLALQTQHHSTAVIG